MTTNSSIGKAILHSEWFKDSVARAREENLNNIGNIAMNYWTSQNRESWNAFLDAVLLPALRARAEAEAQDVIMRIKSGDLRGDRTDEEVDLTVNSVLEQLHGMLEHAPKHLRYTEEDVLKYEDCWRKFRDLTILPLDLRDLLQ